MKSILIELTLFTGNTTVVSWSEGNILADGL